jgi:formate-dependent nitrite reductase membrane component NrfD
MDLFVADPEWRWWIILYFYFGGIASGAYFTAVLIDVIGREEDGPLARIGYWLTQPLLVLCAVFLIVDLTRPERFWHMLLKSEVVHQALAEGWPRGGWGTMGGALLLKYWSPMSAGAWALAVFGLCSFLSCLGSLWPHGRLANLMRHGPLARVFQFVGITVGFFVASYTGALVSATNQPLWSDNNWVAPLFLCSAASTGVATMLLIARLRRAAAPAALNRLGHADAWSIGLELVVFAVFLLSLGGLLGPVLQTTNGKLLLGGTLLVGLLVPLALHWFGEAAAFGAAACTLLGGLILRYALLTASPELLALQPKLPAVPANQVGTPGRVLLPGFSPEDGRQPGGGLGADPNNRPADLKPRSKVFYQ